VVSFIGCLLYLQGKKAWYSLDRRLGGPQSWSVSGGKEKKIPTPTGNRSLVIQPIV